MSGVRLIALDLDGTLMDPSDRVSDEDRRALGEAAAAGIELVISTGRPYSGVPSELFRGMGIRYAMTCNGAAIYDMSTDTLLDERCFAPETVRRIREATEGLDLLMDMMADGTGVMDAGIAERLDTLEIDDGFRAYLRRTRRFIPDPIGRAVKGDLNARKITLNFFPDGRGGWRDRDRAVRAIAAIEDVRGVCGGGSDLELTRADVTKASGLERLCGRLGIGMAETMACGDSENDIDLIRAAGKGVAMANAFPATKAAADFVSRSNAESGVAYAIRALALGNEIA